MKRSLKTGGGDEKKKITEMWISGGEARNSGEESGGFGRKRGGDSVLKAVLSGEIDRFSKSL
jgi:hypothetical protein